MQEKLVLVEPVFIGHRAGEHLDLVGAGAGGDHFGGRQEPAPAAGGQFDRWARLRIEQACSSTHKRFKDEAMNTMRSIILLSAAMLLVSGCRTPKYGKEQQLALSSSRAEVWAVAPALNLSGVAQVDPVLQADLLYQQLQQVQGLRIIPVNRVIEIFQALQIEKIQTQQQAYLICDLLGCQAIVVPTVTAFDPYNPPKFGGSLQWFAKPGTFERPETLDPRELARKSQDDAPLALAARADFLQSVGMFDAANGTTRAAVLKYATGRNDPVGPLGAREYFLSMDRYCGFAYHELIKDLLAQRQ